GIRTLWSCEYEDYQTSIIKKNFGEEHEINRDIKTYSNPTFVDIISGGFPCQDISVAGKGVGIVGERSGLWTEMYRVIREVRPKYIIIENSPMLLIRGFERVLCNLSEIGYDAEWQCLSGTDFGIQQGRERLYCLAYSCEINSKRSMQESIFRKPYLSGQYTRVYPGWRTRQSIPSPRFAGKSNELPDRVDRTECIGNAVQPIIAHYLFECIKGFDKQL
ncbi:DNA cytosine methyltransferase, partial [Bacteroides fragilis]|nr:DNA cytosine methyltransferase [Bacteroides fragilis]